MRTMFIPLALLIVACDTNMPQPMAESSSIEMDAEEVTVEESFYVEPEHVAAEIPGLVYPAEQLLSPAARARTDEVGYVIPKEDIVIERTIFLEDSATSVKCQVPMQSMVTSEGNSDGAVYVTITPDNADPAYPNVSVCAEGLSIMSGLGWAMAFAGVRDPKG